MVPRYTCVTITCHVAVIARAGPNGEGGGEVFLVLGGHYSVSVTDAVSVTVVLTRGV